MSAQTAPVIEPEVVAADGRRLLVSEAGDPAGFPVIVQNGAPSSRLMYPPHARSASAGGIRLISYDRPGYGASDPLPGRSIADAATDVRAIASALGIERCGVWGFSTGAPHALACAALLPGVVVAAVVLASWAPPDLADFDFLGTLPPDEATETRWMLDRPDKARPSYDAEQERRLAMAAAHLGAKLPPPDAAFADYRVATYRSGLESSVEGWWEDDWALLHPWGFRVDHVSVPVRLRHGRRDRDVPISHGRWLAAHLPRVEASFTGDDHRSLFLGDPSVDFDWLRATARGGPRTG